MSIYDLYWTKPVEIKMQCGLTRSFRHPYDALDFLECEWPTRHGPAYRRAVLWCGQSLETEQLAGLARCSFMTAAREAGMLVPGRPTMRCGTVAAPHGRRRQTLSPPERASDQGRAR